MEREVASDGAPLDLGDLVLEPGLTLVVTVLDEQRRPMRGAGVYSTQPPGEQSESCVTRASGACPLEGLHSGPVKVSVQVEDAPGKTVEHRVEAGGGALEVVLERGPGTLEGTLRVSTGSPLGARVSLKGTAYRSARCDEAGAFSFAGVSAGRQVVEFSEWSFTWWTTAQVGVGTTNVQVGPTPGGARLELKVPGPAATPPANVLLMQGAAAPTRAADLESPPAELLAQAATGVRVEVMTFPLVVDGLPPGVWTVSSEGEKDGVVKTQTVTLGVGQSLVVELPAGPPRTHW